MDLGDFLESVYLPSRLGTGKGWHQQLRISTRALSQWARRPLSIGQITERLLLRFLAWYSREHAPSTVNDRRTQLLAIVVYAYRKGYTSQNPATWDVPKLREPRRLATAWTRDEVARLVVQARTLKGMVAGIPLGLWFSSIILACWDTSARIGSLLAAETRNVSLQQGYLILLHSKTACEQLFWLSDQTLAAVASIYCPHRPLVWPWPHDRRHLFRQFRRRIVRPAGLQAESSLGLFHKLRRSRLSDAARVSLEDARRLAGHSNPAVTARHYVDPRIADPGVRPPGLESAGEDGRMWFI